jgi:hypothetical protein
MSMTEDATSGNVQDNEAAQSETGKQESKASTEEKSSSTDNIKGANKGAEDPPSESNSQEIPRIVEVAQDDRKGEAKESETNVEGSTPKHGAGDEGTKEEEKTDVQQIFPRRRRYPRVNQACNGR